MEITLNKTQNQQIKYDDNFNEDEYIKVRFYDKYLFLIHKLKYLYLHEYIEVINILLSFEKFYSISDKEDPNLYDLKGYYTYDKRHEDIKKLYTDNNFDTRDKIYCYRKGEPSDEFVVDKMVKLFQLCCKGVIEIEWDYDNLDEDNLPTSICTEVKDFEKLNDDLTLFSWNPYKWNEYDVEINKDLYDFLITFPDTLANSIMLLQEDWIIENENDYKFVIDSISSSSKNIDDFYIGDYIDYKSFTFARLSVIFESINGNRIYDRLSALYEHKSGIPLTFEIPYWLSEEYKKLVNKLKKLPLCELYPLLSITNYITSTYYKIFSSLFEEDEYSALSIHLNNNNNKSTNVIFSLFKILCQDTNGNFDAVRYDILDKSQNFMRLMLLNEQAKENKKKKNAEILKNKNKIDNDKNNNDNE